MNKSYATYTLEFPVEFGSESITSLNLVRPNAGVMKSVNLQNFTMADQIELIRKIASIPNSDLPMSPKLIESLDFADFARIGELIASWFPKPAST